MCVEAFRRSERPGAEDDGASGSGHIRLEAQDAGVTGDLKPVFSGLAEITAACVGCHAGYRLK